MAGPGLCIVVGVGSCSAAEAIEVLRPHVHDIGVSSPGTVDFYVSSTSAFGGRYRGDLRPFILSIEPMWTEETTDADIQRVLGGRPCEFVVVAAMCNSFQDHLILAEVTAFVAFRLQALVSLDSYIPLPESVTAKGRRLPLRKPPAYPYEVNLVDHQVLGEWARHELFSLVK